MYKLLLKDFLLLKKVLWFPFIYAFGMSVAFSDTYAGALSASTIGVSYMLMIQACARDEKNKSELMLNSLPIRRRDIVLAKYLSIIPYAIIGILAYLLTQGIIYVTGFPITLSNLSFEVVFGVHIAIIGMISIYFPIYFKLGYLRSNIVATILFLGGFFLTIALIRNGLRGIYSPYTQNALNRVGNWVQTQTDWQIISYLIVLMLITLATSFFLSLRFYAKREF
ncbi:MAG: ABC-2 transporter permease [Desulfosporosinus sp.]|nr:ABC-2 transporter permease [Desulfosporosinus sp.]MBC2725736.1 ABC-2 transporter permease [Desulfosporosinus sp.]HBV88589.1 ABC-2 transporter permease [Desulfosporosinus sp.]